LQITEKLTPFVNEALAKHMADEEHYWEVGHVLHPQQGPVLIITIWAKAALLGAWNSQVLLIGNPVEFAEKPEDIDNHIRNAVEQLRQTRSQQLTEMAQGNGNGQTGLLDALGNPPQG